MIAAGTQSNIEEELPSRTSILVAAVRAFGSREPDENVRNPDSMADLLIGPSELALISDHAVSTALTQDYREASQNPAIVLFAGLMLCRTRFIDESLERAVKKGATQVVILGAGFDTRAYRFGELLKHCRVIEVDAMPTQTYKKRRVREVLQDLPKNLTYCAIDFAKDDLMHGLHRVGFKRDEKTLYIWEGVCMYLPESSVRKMLQTIALHSTSGSTLVLDYANSVGIELGKFTPNSAGGIPTSWAEPWIFGVPGANGSEFFRELGFDPGVPVPAYSPEMVRRYGTRQDGTSYAAHVFEQLQRQAPTPPEVPPIGLLEAQKAVTAAGGVYWFTELTVMSKPLES
ncbi:SAM-dependent methyltransferase [Edaphobacter sp. 12200R-103]|jgi:methyltransferase (TIGR00027 family)|uniref:class I SAM-dependent methyltransferase n=1 Tax=Edaphobacter sp. 12200R-103 TaxID=2703788 RepID=UPI00138CCC17|nr:SAM-dependent methyltransferase [Edaphobacter sp. 12200R-103]QHS52585.1 SAM-dependent methyltransferase [Edaphobacter sp. 12200R-103]